MSDIVKFGSVELQIATAAQNHAAAVARAAKAKEVYAPFEKLEYGPDTMEKFDTIETRAKAAVKEISESRLSFTRNLDAIKAELMTPEKELAAITTSIEGKRKAYKQAELKKQQEETARIQAQAQKAQAIVSFVADVKQTVLNLVYGEKTALYQKYFERLTKPKEAEPIPTEFFSLRNTPDAWKNICIKAMNTANLGLMVPVPQPEFATAIQAEKEALIESFESDLAAFRAEIGRAANDLNGILAIGKILGIQQQQQQEAIKVEAEAKQIDAAIEAAEQAVQVQTSAPIEIKTKMVPAPKTKAEVLELIKYWAKEPDVTVEEMVLMASKAMTYAKRKAAKGEQITGVTYIEDVK